MQTAKQHFDFGVELLTMRDELIDSFTPSQKQFLLDLVTAHFRAAELLCEYPVLRAEALPE